MTLKSGLEVTEGHLNRYHSKLGCGFLLAFQSNYGSVLHHLRNKARYWSKIDFFIPACIRRPRSGVRVGILPSRLVHVVTR